MRLPSLSRLPSLPLAGPLRRQPGAAIVGVLLLLAIAVPLVARLSHPALPVMYGGLYGLGLVGGCSLAMQAVAIVLVYRTDRIINFAQVALGLISPIVVFDLQSGAAFLKIGQLVCPPCAGGHLAELPGVPQQVNFWLSLAVGLAAAPLFGFLAHALVMKRFRESPRLVATIVSIALAQTLVVVAFTASSYLQWALGLKGSATGVIDVPYRFEIRWPPIVFHLGDVLMLALGAATFAGLAIFFRRSAIGTVIRAASENTPRAETLGVRVNAITSVIWMFAGLFSGLVATVHAFTVPIDPKFFDVNQTIAMLAAVVAAGLSSLPVAVFAALALGLIQETFSWTLQGTTIYLGSLFFLISLLLLAQRRQASRAELEAAPAFRMSREVRPIPRELRRLPAVRKYLGWGAAAGAIFLLGLPFGLDGDQVQAAATTVVFGMIAISLVPLTGWAGQISLGQLGLAAAGAYVAVLSAQSLPFPLPLLAGVLAGCAAAVVIGIPAIRLRGLQLAIATLAFAVTVTDFLLSPTYLGRYLGSDLPRPVFWGLDLDDERTFYYFSLGLLGMVVLALLGMRRSRTARALIACRDNEPAAQSFGLNLVRVKLMAFGISGAIAGLAGALFAYQERALQSSAFVPADNLQVFLGAVVGGFGAIGGPVLGTAAIYLLNQLNYWVAAYIPTLGLILLLMFAPGGLTEVLFGIRDVILRRLAVRNRIVVPSLLADARVGAGRAAVRANRWKTGAQRFTPLRYRAAGQWVGRDDGGVDAAQQTDENVFAFILGEGGKSLAGEESEA